MIYFFYLVAEKMQEKKWYDLTVKTKLTSTNLWELHCHDATQKCRPKIVFFIYLLKKNRPALFIPADRPNTKWLNLKNPPKTHTLSSAFSDSLRSWLTLEATAPVSPQRRKHSSLFTADHLVLHITPYPTFSFSINYSLSLSK